MWPWQDPYSARDPVQSMPWALPEPGCNSLHPNYTCVWQTTGCLRCMLAGPSMRNKDPHRIALVLMSHVGTPAATSATGVSCFSILCIPSIPKPITHVPQETPGSME